MDTNEVKNSKYDKNFVLATLFGIILFYMVGKYCKIPTGEKDVFIYLQYVILVYLAGRYGPVCGGLVGFVGHLMVDKTSNEAVWISWIIGSAVLGVSIGFICQKYNIDLARHDRKDRRRFAAINALCQIIVWYLLVPVLNITIYKMAASQAFEMGFVAGVNDIVTSIILCDLFLFSFDHIIIRRVVAIFVLINSLILLSYGNYGFGSICLYAFTIIISAYIFLHGRLKPMTTKGIGKWVKIVLCCIFSLFFVSFFFLHVTAILDKPAGDEKCMIILGAGLNGDKPSKILQYRLDKAIEYIEDHPDIVVITTGGQGSDEIMSEGQVMKNYLVNNGCRQDMIYVEDEATDTEENLLNSLAIMKQHGMDENTCVIIVTNDFHCFRSTGEAKECGFTDVHPLAATTPVTLILNSYFREVFSIGKYCIKKFI